MSRSAERRRGRSRPLRDPRYSAYDRQMRTLFVAALAAAGCGGSGEPSQIVYVVTSSTSTGREGGAGGAPASSTSTGGAGGEVSSTSSPTSQGGGASSSTSSTTTIAPPECVLAQDCPGIDSECRSRTCVDGVCGVTLVAEGTVLASQVEGDCARMVCDGAGSVVSQEDLADHGDSGSECVVDACGPSGATHTELPLGTSCAQGGGHLCQDGQCVEYIPVECQIPGGAIYTGCDGESHQDHVATYDTGCFLAGSYTYCAPGEYCHVLIGGHSPVVEGKCR